ncbi:hypothetical protein FSP39_021909 [Pinctada imbricata]|uniref:Uncharacterized protein n=2 Tax=Pinctada TaxID=50425 RepID=A0AA88Y6W6_PINIB|nr:hypothetical protein FSP39_021909 [Pinctada imbricata]
MSEHADADGIVSRAKDEVAKAMEKAMTNQGKDADYEEVVEYIDPIQDPYGKAIKYLEQHNILQLFQSLTTDIVYNKPEDPLGYMLKEIEKMKKNG